MEPPSQNFCLCAIGVRYFALTIPCSLSSVTCSLSIPCSLSSVACSPSSIALNHSLSSVEGKGTGDCSSCVGVMLELANAAAYLLLLCLLIHLCLPTPQESSPSASLLCFLSLFLCC
ncbi:hypothetical protein AAHE18_14G142800 [Arachis hypogaea]